jgi:hypothetical protein
MPLRPDPRLVTLARWHEITSERERAVVLASITQAYTALQDAERAITDPDQQQRYMLTDLVDQLHAARGAIESARRIVEWQP